MSGKDWGRRGSGAIDQDLQILRAVAALIVLIDHAGEQTFENVIWHSFDIQSIFGNLGLFAVQIFFVISGYIMMATNEGNFGSGRNALTFFARRLLRIAPIYYVGTALAVVVLSYSTDTEVSVRQVIFSLGFVAYYSDIEAEGFFPVLGVGWTINFEIFFYLLFATALCFSRRTGVTLCVGMLVLLKMFGFGLQVGRWQPAPENPLIFYTDSIVLLFAAGMLLRQFRATIAVLAGKFGRFFDPNAIVILAGALIVAARSSSTTTRWPLETPLGLFAVALVATTVHQRWMWPDFTRRIGLFLGNASYSIYIFHYLVLLVVFDPLTRAGLGGFGVFSAVVALSLGISIGLYFLIEVPFRHFIETPVKRLLDRLQIPSSHPLARHQPFADMTEAPVNPSAR